MVIHISKMSSPLETHHFEDPSHRGLQENLSVHRIFDSKMRHELLRYKVLEAIRGVEVLVKRWRRVYTFMTDVSPEKEGFI
jgi:hypothetical protein